MVEAVRRCLLCLCTLCAGICITPSSGNGALLQYRMARLCSKAGFGLCNARWFGTSLATFSNKRPLSWTPSCKSQSVIVLIWWIKLQIHLCVLTFELAQSCISRNPLILYKWNSRGTKGSNALNMAFQSQLCQVHLCLFFPPSFPGKMGRSVGGHQRTEGGSRWFLRSLHVWITVASPSLSLFIFIFIVPFY